MYTLMNQNELYINYIALIIFYIFHCFLFVVSFKHCELRSIVRSNDLHGKAAVKLCVRGLPYLLRI